MPNRDSLGDHMKGYENAFRHYFPRRMPVIIRIDGKAFHTYTKGFHKPFDSILMKTMQETAYELCTKIEGVKLAYVQSDEISLLLTNDDTFETEPWFGNNLQKIVSVAASMATMAFNKHFAHEVINGLMTSFNINDMEWHDKLVNIYHPKLDTAMFDARAFVLPANEVCNYFIWRQQDATRNSIQMVAQSNFSHKELQGLNCNKLQDKLFTEKGINWNDFSVPEKRGTCIVKVPIFTSEAILPKMKWVIDYNIPIFTEHREYIEERLNGTSNNKD